jgi:hypothetical protein
MADKKTKKLEQAETAVEPNITEAAIDAAEQAETTKEEKRTATPVAKAGKRSTKALAEAEEKEAKEERKAEAKAEEAAEKEKPKVVVTPTRSRLERRGKKYREQAKQIDATKQYSLSEALELASKTSPTKFDATVEVHVRLGLDPRQADQNIRDIVSWTLTY